MLRSFAGPHYNEQRSPRGNGTLVVSSLVSSVYVRLRSLVFGRMRRCRSRTLTVFGELLSLLLKIGRSAVRPRPWPPPLTSCNGTVASGDGSSGCHAWCMRAARCVVPSVASSAFAGFRFPPELVTLAVRWYLRFGLSYRDVEELALTI